MISSYIMDIYSQSHLGWHFRKFFQSSKLKARTSLFTETWQKRRSSFELWAFENDTPNGIGCTCILWIYYACYAYIVDVMHILCHCVYHRYKHVYCSIHILLMLCIYYVTHAHTCHAYIMSSVKYVWNKIHVYIDDIHNVQIYKGYHMDVYIICMQIMYMHTRFTLYIMYIFMHTMYTYVLCVYT